MHWQNFVGGTVSPQFMGAAGFMFVLVILWTLAWKGMALWKAAKEGSKPWFVVLLVVNTVGILDILYLYVFSRKSKRSVEPPVQM